MPRKKLRYPKTAWTPDPEKWRKLLEKGGHPKQEPPIEPKGGWQLFRWDTLEDVPQDEKSRPC